VRFSKHIHGKLRIRALGILSGRTKVATYKVQWRTGWLGIDGEGELEHTQKQSKAYLMLVSYLVDCWLQPLQYVVLLFVI
jgi:hypothetical protein